MIRVRAVRAKNIKTAVVKTKRDKVIEALLAEYPDAKCALDYDTVYHLLIAVVLSAQTTDISVNKITPQLFRKAPDAFAMEKLSQEEIESIIHSIGMYRQKAKNIKALSAVLCEKYSGEVPGDFDKLVELPGVGRKTANVVLAEAFGQQRIAVDTHVFRVANRIGLADAEDVLAAEQSLMKAIPEDKWTAMHHALIWHGRRVCSARKPQCDNCCINAICNKKL